MEQITYPEFLKVELRVGTILSVLEFPEAKKPAYKLSIDFGELGIKQSSAQITHNYTKETLIGKQVVAVVNFPRKQIANFFSECLVTGFEAKDKTIVLISPDKPVPNGSKLC